MRNKSVNISADKKKKNLAAKKKRAEKKAADAAAIAKVMDDAFRIFVK